MKEFDPILNERQARVKRERAECAALITGYLQEPVVRQALAAGEAGVAADHLRALTAGYPQITHDGRLADAMPLDERLVLFPFTLSAGLKLAEQLRLDAPKDLITWRGSVRPLFRCIHVVPVSEVIVRLLAIPRPVVNSVVAALNTDFVVVVTTTEEAMALDNGSITPPRSVADRAEVSNEKHETHHDQRWHPCLSRALNQNERHTLQLQVMTRLYLRRQ
ncbi:MAG: hypothetical protein IPN38_14535 [Flavobacteriales bacterium]|nr:hypothetical protein [Flavobacteriales bacterium]